MQHHEYATPCCPRQVPPIAHKHTACGKSSPPYKLNGMRIWLPLANGNYLTLPPRCFLFRKPMEEVAGCWWVLTSSSSSWVSQRWWKQAPETATRSALGRSGCGSGHPGHQRSQSAIHQCTQLHSVQSFQGGCLLGGFLLGHARRRMHGPHSVDQHKINVRGVNTGQKKLANYWKHCLTNRISVM